MIGGRRTALPTLQRLVIRMTSGCNMMTVLYVQKVVAPGQVYVELVVERTVVVAVQGNQVSIPGTRPRKRRMRL